MTRLVTECGGGDGDDPSCVQVQDIFPRCQFRYVQGAGHWVHSQKPAEVMQLMRDFLG